MLDVPYERLEKLINHIQNHTSVKTCPNKAGDVVSIEFTDEVSDKVMIFYLVDENYDGDWKVSDYKKL